MSPKLDTTLINFTETEDACAEKNGGTTLHTPFLFEVQPLSTTFPTSGV